MKTMGLSAACAALPGTSAAGWFSGRRKPKSLRLVFFTDVHTRKEWDTPLALERAAAAVNAQKPDLVVAGGDLITDGFEVHPEAVAHRWDLYMAFHRMIEAPVYAAMGNHDLVGAVPKDGSAPESDPRATFRSRMALDRTYYSFEAGNCHFMILDAIEIIGGKLKYRGWVDLEQLKWIKGDLANTSKEKNIVIVSHIPLVTAFYQRTRGSGEPSPLNRVVSNAREVLDLFENRPPLLVLQGHLHVLEALQSMGTTFLTGGAVCAKWWRGPYYGTEEGFVMAEVCEKSLHWDYIEYSWDARRPRTG